MIQTAGFSSLRGLRNETFKFELHSVTGVDRVNSHFNKMLSCVALILRIHVANAQNRRTVRQSRDRKLFRDKLTAVKFSEVQN